MGAKRAITVAVSPLDACSCSRGRNRSRPANRVDSKKGSRAKIRANQT